MVVARSRQAISGTPPVTRSGPSNAPTSPSGTHLVEPTQKPPTAATLLFTQRDHVRCRPASCRCHSDRTLRTSRWRRRWSSPRHGGDRVLRYPSTPAILAVHYNADGVPNRLAAKSVGTAFSLVFVQGGLTAVIDPGVVTADVDRDGHVLGAAGGRTPDSGRRRRGNRDPGQAQSRERSRQAGHRPDPPR
jgi:hypothetical protein